MAECIDSVKVWSAARRRWAVVIFTILVFPVAVWIGCRMGTMFVQADTESYLAMAQGKATMLPFAARQLGPLLARVTANEFHLPVESAFFDLGWAYLLFFLAVTAWLVVRSGAPRWMFFAVGGLMFWGFQFNALVMPDLLYAALLCGLLLLLRQGWGMAAGLMMFPLMLSRESTLLALVCFLIAGWRRLRKGEMATAVIAVGTAMVVVNRLTQAALPNKEHISPMLYMIAKMPWNFMRNVAGIGVWANVYPTCAVPKWQMAVHLGPLHAIGTCGFFPDVPPQAIAVGAAMFGLLPVMVWNVRKETLRTGGREDLMLRFALLYGTVSFLMAPLLGEAFPRLYGYGWPLFLVALPILLARAGADFTSNWAAAAFLGVHWFLSWSMVWAFPRWLFQVSVVCWILGWILLRTTFRAGGGSDGGEGVPAGGG